MPEKIGRLQRLRRIGAGGFASVWLYRDPDLDSPVAVKALADNWAQRPDVRERFLTEARILRKAENEHIVRVYDIGEVDEIPYSVMTYADRGSVADLITPGVPGDPRLTAMLMTQAGIGLDALHRHGIIHRDIKPNNLLLRAEPDGGLRLLVADLGVAKEMLHASGLTQVVGTPAFMAPEQADGLGVDLRADVHGLGAVAYTMLTGQYVRTGGVEEMMSAQAPTPPSHFAELSPDVDAVILRAVDPDAERRWPDVLSFTKALSVTLNALRHPDDQDTSEQAAITIAMPAPASVSPTSRGTAGRPSGVNPSPALDSPALDSPVSSTSPARLYAGTSAAATASRLTPATPAEVSPALDSPETPPRSGAGIWPTVLATLLVLIGTFLLSYVLVTWLF